MARLMVRNAARNCSDMVSLASAVSHHIADLDRRAQFLSVATGDSQARPATGASAAMGAAAPEAGTGAYKSESNRRPLTEPLIARATQTMTRHLGPIAKLLVKRKAEQCDGDAGAFVQSLLAELPAKDRDAVAQALQSE
jgi:eukaryotic-like serine/threonine-protein kinase